MSSSFHHFRFLSSPPLGQREKAKEGVVIVVVEGTVRNRRLKCRPWISFCEGGLDGTSLLTRVAVLQGMRRAKLSRGEKLFAGGTDVWVGVGRAPEGRPKDEDGGRGRSAPTYAHPESISLRSNPGQTPTILPQPCPLPPRGKKKKEESFQNMEN